MDNFEKVPKGIFDKVTNNKELFISEFKEKLEEVFPSAVKDGIVDFEALLNEFGKYAETDEKEKYNMTWVGKKEAIRKGNEDIVGKTLKYVPEDSKNPDTTQNLYIEGDNLEVLKLLRNSYYGKVKMIYIDPPYNRGEDLIYKDNYSVSVSEYEKRTGNMDENGRRLSVNSAGSGKFHSDWLNMMYPLVRVSRDLLEDGGLIFLSIDENEVENLIKICNEVFGEKSHINTISVKMSEASGNKMAHADKRLPKLKEYILVYANGNAKLNMVKRAKEKWDSEYNILFENLTIEQSKIIKSIIGKEEKCEEDVKKVDDILETLETVSVNSKLKELNLDNSKKEEWLKENAYRIFRTASSTSVKQLCDEKKKYNKNKYFSVLSKRDKLLYFVKSDYESNSKSPRVQILFADENLSVSVGDFWDDINTTGLEFEGGVSYKNGKKPLKLINRLIELGTNKDSLILDYFAGSSTTAHAVLDANVNDMGNRKFIMVQIDEDLNTSYEKATGEAKNTIKEAIHFLDDIDKPRVLSEIGKERIRRAGDKIIEENKDKEGIENLDIGFKVFRVADTNIKWISDTLSQNSRIEDHKGDLSLKDRLDFNPHFTDIDVVYEMMLKRQDIELTERIDKLEDIGDRTYLVGYTVLVCLEEEVTEEMVKKISEIDTSLSWIVFRDSAFGDDINLKTNTMNLLRTLIKEKNPKSKNQKILWI